jgi:hypothetical protein
MEAELSVFGELCVLRFFQQLRGNCVEKGKFLIARL